MERNYYTEGFESFLKEKADQYKLFPSERIWKNIHRQLHPRRNWPYFAAVIFLLGIGITGKYYVGNAKILVAAATATAGLDEKNSSNIENNIPVPASSVIATSKLNKSKSYRANSSIDEAKTMISPVVQDFGLNKFSFQYPDLNNNPEKTYPLSLIESGRVITSTAFIPGDNKKIPQAIEFTAQEEQEVDKNMFVNGTAKDKWDWQLYFSPTVSYRKLSGSASKVPYSYSGIAYSANFGYPSDVNNAVTHTPSIGMELGTAMVYNVSTNFRFKAGIQFNYNQYRVKAYSYIPELAPYGLNPNGFIASPLTVVSHYRNFDGYTPTWLKNEHFMISMPLGLEVGILGNSRVQFSIAGSLQPTYILNNKSFLISTNLKNYAEEASLYRKWNINSAVETFLSINTGTVKWVVGPQLRYQLLSSYKNKYPIREHLLDYGIKVGVNKTLK